MSQRAIPLPDVPRPPGLSAVEIQQEYYEAVGSVDWELYEKEDRKYLLQKIAVALCGPPTKEGNLESKPTDDSDTKKKSQKDPIKNKDKHKKDKKPEDELKLQGYELRDEESIIKVFNKICEQAKYSHDGEKVYIKILRVISVIPKEEVPFYKLTPNDYWVNLHDKNGDHVHTFIFHVFCMRQCIPMTAGAKACKVYIDHDARVYKKWNAYLAENTLVKSVLVVPENGKYTGTFGKDLSQIQTDDVPKVKLSVVPSPALGLGARVLDVSDQLSTVANVGAIVGIVGALALPAVAPAALGAAVGIGVVTGTYGIVRASINLADRGMHEQNIGLGDSESRGYWINILVSTVGISCGAASKLLSQAAASGTNVKFLMNAVQFLQYSNLGTGALGVANSLTDMIIKYQKYNETPSKLEVFQLTTSLLFLGIGVMSNQTAQEIVQDAQANKINEIRDSLSSNNKRKMFDKVTAETRRVKGTINGNSEVITALKKIENKDEFFGKLRGMNKQLNKNKLRISLSADGNPVINNQHNIRVADLQALGRRGREQLFAKYGHAKIDSKNAPTRLFASNSTASVSVSQQTSILTIRPEEIIKITNLIVNLSTMDQEFIAEFLSDMSASCHDVFLLICAEVIASLVPKEIDQLLGLNRNYKVQIILFVFDYLKSMIDVNDTDSDISFINVLKKYVKDGRISKETILRIKRVLFDRVSQKKKLFDDPHMFDLMHDYDKRNNKQFLDLCPGETIKIAGHSILIKNSTTEKLEEWFQTFFLSQLQCEILLSICFKIISSLSTSEIHRLHDINPDDDAIKIVCYYLLYKIGGIFDYLNDDFLQDDLIHDIAINVKEKLLRWRNGLVLRPHETCEICRGRRYKNE